MYELPSEERDNREALRITHKVEEIQDSKPSISAAG